MTSIPKKIDLPFNLRAFPATEEEKDAFFRAAKKNDIAELDAILKKWPNAAKEWRIEEGMFSITGRPVIRAALNELSEETLVFLLQHGADINQRDTDESIFPLYCAACQGRADKIEMLLSYGADINQQTKFGDTALITAAENEKAACADLLIISGADVGIAGCAGKTVWDQANPHMTQVIKSAQKRLQEYQENLKNAKPAAPEEDPDNVKTTSEIILPKPAIPRGHHHHKAKAPAAEPVAQTPPTAEPAPTDTKNKRKSFWDKFKL